MQANNQSKGLAKGTATVLVCAVLLLLMLLPGSPFSSASWQELADRFYKNFIVDHRYTMILKGLRNTIMITAGATVLGIVIGLVLSIIRVAYRAGAKIGILNEIANVYVTVIRGTPVMVQLMIWNFTIFASIRDLNVVAVATLAFGVNSGAYVAEIFRAGIEAIDKGQMEAGRSLGLSYGLTMRKIILPQAMKNSLPVLINEFISLLKETSIAGYIAVDELTRAAQNIQSITLESSQPLIMAALIYLAIVMALTAFMGRVERKLRRSER